MNEIILIITLGYSPGSATGTSLEVLEYVQPDLKTCVSQQEMINDLHVRRFNYKSVCVSRVKPQ